MHTIRGLAVHYSIRLPSIIGTEAMQKFGIDILTEGFSNNYRNDIDPRITNGFATAGLRMGHSLIPSIAEYVCKHIMYKYNCTPQK